VSRRARYQIVVASFLLAWATFSAAQEGRQQKQNRQFQSAVAQYNAGQYDAAAAQLEILVPQVPDNFEAQELLGMVYAAMLEDAKAIEHLEAAANVKPTSAAARTNLGASLSRLDRTALAEEQFRKALVLAPRDYDANHDLGELYVQENKIADAQPLLAEAQRAHPDAYDNGYDLAMAYLLTGQLPQAGQTIQSLLRLKNTGELHNLLGQVEEKDRQYVAAVNEFETASHMDPSEDNLFDWGSELLLHRTYEPAIDVFRAASQRYPKSPRLLIGLGMSLYARGLYEDAIKALLSAADLDPMAGATCFCPRPTRAFRVRQTTSSSDFSVTPSLSQTTPWRSTTMR
jgi:tetratricopeptide (TPR) repeat protein